MATPKDSNESLPLIELIVNGVKLSLSPLKNESTGQTGTISVSQNTRHQTIDFTNFTGRLRIVSTSTSSSSTERGRDRRTRRTNTSSTDTDMEVNGSLERPRARSPSEEEEKRERSVSRSLSRERPFRRLHAREPLNTTTRTDQEGDRSIDSVDTMSLHSSTSALHALCASPTATLDELHQALEDHPEAVLEPDKEGKFPLHILSENIPLLQTQRGRDDTREFALVLADRYLDALTFPDAAGRLPFLLLIEEWVDTTYRSAAASASKGNTSRGFGLVRALSNISLSRHGNDNHDGPHPPHTSGRRGLFDRNSESFLSRKGSHLMEESPDTCIGGPSAYKLCPYVVLTVQAEWAFAMLSTILNRINASHKRDEAMFVRSTIASAVATIPYLLKTILLIEQEDVRLRLLRESMIQRVLLSPPSCGKWICPMLHRRGFASQRAVDYFVEISRVTVAGYVGPKRMPRSDDVEEFESDRASVFETLGGISRVIPSLAILDQRETERAAATDAVWDIVGRSMSRPIVVGILALDLLFHLVLMFVFRFDVSHEPFDLLSQLNDSLSKKLSNGLIVSLCMYFLLRKTSEVFSLLRISRQAFRAYSLDLWNLIDIAAVVLALLSLPVDGNAALFSITTAALWLKLLGFLKAINMEFATFILAIIEIMKDIKWFLVVLGIFILMFGDMIHIITTRSGSNYCEDGAAPPQFCSQDAVSPSYLKMYSVVVGDVALDDFSYNPAVSLLFCIFTLYGVIILLNVLIAIVSDSYEKSVTRAKFLFGRARVGFAVTHVAQEQFLQCTPMPSFEGLHTCCSREFTLWIVGSIGRWVMLAVMVWTFALAEVYLIVMGMDSPEEGSTGLRVVSMVLIVVLSVILWIAMTLLLQNLFQETLNRVAGSLHLMSLHEKLNSSLHRVLQFITEHLLGIHQATGLEDSQGWHGRFEFFEQTMQRLLETTELNLSRNIHVSEERVKTHDSKVGEDVKAHAEDLLLSRKDK